MLTEGNLSEVECTSPERRFVYCIDMIKDDDAKLEAWEEQRDKRTAKMWFGTMFYGYITLFVMATLADNAYECGMPPCSPYPFMVFISLVIGFVISFISLRLS